MTFSINPSEKFALLILRVDDLDVLRMSINLARSINKQFGNSYCSRAIERISEEVESTIDIYRRNSDED